MESLASPRARRVATLTAGWTLLVPGVALLVLPGPGVPLILVGLALIGREQAWARNLRERVAARAARAARLFRRHSATP